jgi:hypothetical protein
MRMLDSGVIQVSEVEETIFKTTFELKNNIYVKPPLFIITEEVF